MDTAVGCGLNIGLDVEVLYILGRPIPLLELLLWSTVHVQLCGKTSLMKERLNIHCQIAKHVSITTVDFKGNSHRQPHYSMITIMTYNLHHL